jgi:HD-GYP domain-containing protein (c-di-GMP phosphodiesterase class II)
MPLPSHSPLLLGRLCVHTRDLLDVDEAAVFARDHASGGDLIALASAGMAGVVGRSFPAAGGLAGMAMSSGQPLYVPDGEHLERRRATASAPVAAGGEVEGALTVGMRSRALRLGVRELELLGRLAGLVGSSLRHGELRGDRQLRAIRMLVAELELADPQTARHSDEVTRLAVRVGAALGLSGLELLELELGSRLHDVGKLRVPPAILRKAGRLTASEREVMRQHALWGSEMVGEIPGLEAVALVVRFHHERYDGHGYPDGLAGERIPLVSRVLAACDAYGAMTSDRPYRRALGPAAALRELRRCAGTQFDPRVSAELERCSLAQDLDHEPLRSASVEFGVEDLLPRA